MKREKANLCLNLINFILDLFFFSFHPKNRGESRATDDDVYSEYPVIVHLQKKKKKNG